MSSVSGYGMTEIVALSHLAPLDLPLGDAKHLTSCGKLLDCFQSKVSAPYTTKIVILETLIIIFRHFYSIIHPTNRITSLLVNCFIYF